MNKDYIDRYEQIAGYKLKEFGEYEQGEKSQTTTNKQKSKDHGEVFTPLWIVDEMVKEMQEQLGTDDLSTVSTSDCCAGYGAFTIRMLQSIGNEDRAKRWLHSNHLMTEYQISSALKLVYIFGPGINLIVGDSVAAYEYMKPKRITAVGILFQVDDTFHRYTGTIKRFYNEINEDNWETVIDKYVSIFERKVELSRALKAKDDE